MKRTEVSMLIRTVFLCVEVLICDKPLLTGPGGIGCASELKWGTLMLLPIDIGGPEAYHDKIRTKQTNKQTNTQKVAAIQLPQTIVHSKQSSDFIYRCGFLVTV